MAESADYSCRRLRPGYRRHTSRGAEGKRLGPVGRELLPMETIRMDAMLTPAAKALPALHTWGLGMGVSTSEAVGGCGSG